MEPIDLLTRWTALAALCCGLLVIGCRWTAQAPQEVAFRWIWSAGCALYLAHVGLAFHFYHHWSHAAAYESTAERTRQMVGVESGTGLYLNYLFTLLWPVDALWWWSRPVSYNNRSRWLTGSYFAFFGFMAFNATVVFGGGSARWLGLACCLAVGALLWRRRRVAIPQSCREHRIECCCETQRDVSQEHDS
jgi:hypothetical protein